MIEVMPYMHRLSLTALIGATLLIASPAIALYNNVYLSTNEANSKIVGTWLTNVLPTIETKAETSGTVQLSPEPVTPSLTEDVTFSPSVQPGATFQQVGDDFSEYRNAFGSQY